MFKTLAKTILLLSMVLLLVACAPETMRMTLIAEDIVWEPEVITAEPGQLIELTIRNDGALDHNFVISEMGIDVLVSPGDADVITFTIDEAGRIDFICNIPGHEEAGMVGEIVIGE